MILIANISCSSESSRTIFILPKMYILGNINSLQDVLGNMHVLQGVLGGMHVLQGVLGNIHVSRMSWVVCISSRMQI